MSEVIIPPNATATRTLYIESYGCAMNFSDSEIIASIMGEHGFASTQDELDADVIFLNTCAIRDNAEQRIRERLKHLRGNKKHNKELIIGVLGCMAERLKEKLLAALRGGIKTVLIPEENVKDLQEIPDNVKSGLEIVPVKWIDKVLEIALERLPTPLPDDMAVVTAPPAAEGDIKAQTIKH